MWRNKVMQRRFKKMKCVNEFNLICSSEYILSPAEIEAKAKLYKDLEAGRLHVPDCVYDYILSKRTALHCLALLKGGK